MMKYRRKMDVMLTSGVIKFFVITSILNIVYLMPATLTMHQNAKIGLLDPDTQREVDYIIFETVLSVVFKSFIDLQINIYFVLNGCLGFFYLFLAMLFIRVVRYAYLEVYLFHRVDLFLYLFYILSNAARILISFLWTLRCRRYITRRNAQVCNNNISSSITYYNVYYILEGCSLVIINHSIYSVLMKIYNEEYTSLDETVNIFWTGVVACTGWYFLWLDKKHMEKKWFMWTFYLINIVRLIIIYGRTGEIRLYLNIYYREATVSERIDRIMHKISNLPRVWRNVLLNFLDNMEYFVIGIVYNVYFVWYCVILYKIRRGGSVFTAQNRGRIPIEKPLTSEEDSTEE